MPCEFSANTVLCAKFVYSTKSTASKDWCNVKIGDIAIVMCVPYLQSNGLFAIDLLHTSDVVTWKRSTRADLIDSLLSIYEILK
jgi:hypothetical protein